MNKIIYLDAAASALKPDVVIDAEMDFLRNKYANAGRGICPRAAAVDDMVRGARGAVADFIHANENQIVFTSGATDALNRAHDIILNTIGGGKKVLRVGVSYIDHHSARMPWMMSEKAGRCELVVCPLDDKYNIDVSKIVDVDVMVITAMSNVFGVAQDVAEIVRVAHEKNPDVITVIDAAQYVAHAEINAAAWGADFICFSGHKIGADTGLGVMYIRDAARFAPDRFGGGMVNKIIGDELIFNDGVHGFEAGTLPLTQIAGFPAAIDAWRAWPGAHDIIGAMWDALSQNPRIKILTARDASVLTFVARDIHVLDLGAYAGARGLCMRVGNMCASWAMRALHIPGAARLSVGPWNTMDDAIRATEIINGIVK
ncbi:aminotransferase class V-fold PLP-dependent enzyme [bacterium]|nr:aminotransferase class V-fold PLP-dependent enzyme [bacterium]